MRKKNGVACVEVSHRLAVGGITHQRVPTLHTTETFFLWQAGPYITRQRVPLTVVYDRHPTTAAWIPMFHANIAMPNCISERDSLGLGF